MNKQASQFLGKPFIQWYEIDLPPALAGGIKDSIPIGFSQILV